MTRTRRLCGPLLAALALVSAVLALGACGSSEEEKTDLMEGEPVTLGELQYNVLFSRFLNRNDVEDREYLVGQPPPPGDAAYFGVFLQMINKSHDEEGVIPEQFRIVDTEEQAFLSIPSDSIYALHLGDSIGPEDIVPALDSSPQTGPIEASMVLFQIPDAAAENRPLKFVIPGIDGPATIDLDV